MSNDIAPAYPFERDASGRFATASDWQRLEMDIIQAVLTPMGARPMQKSIGCNLAQLMFLNPSDESLPAEADPRNALAKKYVTDAVSTAVPDAAIYDVLVRNENDGKSIYVTITYGFAGGNEKKQTAILYSG